MKKKEKADYKYWFPKSYLVAIAFFATAFVIGGLCFGLWGRFLPYFWLRVFLSCLCFLFGALFLFFLGLGIHWYRTFCYDGKRQMAKEIVEGVSDFCQGIQGKILDVGCGSGALTISLAKKNPKATVYGIDKWGIEYIDITRNLCENNAKIEGVDNVFFLSGDIRHLDFPDNYFDHVSSNYCYSNLVGFDKQQLILESLRVLKKGGTFAIHDVMDWLHYGDMDFFLDKLKRMGYEDVHFVPTAKRMFMTEAEAFFLSLNGSYLLYGKK